MARPKNSEDKNRKFLLNRLQDMYGADFDPIMKAAENAMEMQNLAAPKFTEDQLSELDASEVMKVTESEFTRRKECVVAWDRIGQYITPKLKAIEISGDLELNAHEEWLARMANAGK